MAVSREVRQKTDTVSTNRELTVACVPARPGMEAIMREMPVANTWVGVTISPEAYSVQMKDTAHRETRASAHSMSMPP